LYPTRNTTSTPSSARARVEDLTATIPRSERVEGGLDVDGGRVVHRQARDSASSSASCRLCNSTRIRVATWDCSVVSDEFSSAFTRREDLFRSAERRARHLGLGGQRSPRIVTPVVIVANLEIALDKLRALGPLPSGTVLAELDEVLRDAAEGAERVRTIVRDLKIFSRASTTLPDRSPKGLAPAVGNGTVHSARDANSLSCRLGSGNIRAQIAYARSRRELHVTPSQCHLVLHAIRPEWASAQILLPCDLRPSTAGIVIGVGLR
jgi:hypothetical protein